MEAKRGILLVRKREVPLGGNVTPLPSLERREGALHGTGTPLPDFLILVGPFQ